MQHAKVKAWMDREGLTYEGAGDLVGISGQSFHAAVMRGTFSRAVTGKLMALTGLPWEDFLTPTEYRELRALRRKLVAA